LTALNSLHPSSRPPHFVARKAWQSTVSRDTVDDRPTIDNPPKGELWADQADDRPSRRQRDIATRVDILRQMEQKVAEHDDAPDFAYDAVTLCQRELERICALSDSEYEHEPPRFTGWQCNNLALT
jgi:hypothetical protein